MPSHPTSTEENYLKALYKLQAADANVSTNAMAQELNTTPASVTDMIKRLHEKGLVEHRPYHGTTLTQAGMAIALRTIRKHRLWEVFLVDKLKFSWDEVHETAEQLEHIHSEKLIQKLEEFLGYPKFDPHGDPIPDDQGRMNNRHTLPLAEVAVGLKVVVARVTMDNPDFLRYLDRLRIAINAELTMVEHIPFDNARVVRLGGAEVILSSTIAQHILVVPVG